MSTLSKARLAALARDERLYRITIIETDGTRRRGPVLRSLEAHGYMEAHDRLADVTGTRCEAHEVFVVDFAPSGAKGGAL